MKILLVEDDSLVAKGIVRDWPIPSDEIEVVPTFSQCARAIGNAQIDEYDAVILDMNLPDGNGLQALTDLRRRSGMPAIVISGSGSAESRANTLDVGADDYLMKPFSIRELQARVHRVVTRVRGHITADTVINFEIFQYDHASKLLSLPDSRWTLTDLESRLLFQLVSHAGKVCGRKHLYESACLRTFRPHDKTIDIYIGRLRNIFSKFTNEDVIETVRGVGYRFVLAPKQN